MKNQTDLGNIVVGILGGGQLARMTVEAASRLNFKVAILEAEEDSPAGRIAAFEITGGWNNLEALEKLARVCDVITLENEFVDIDVLQRLEASGCSVYPSALTMALVQDKANQKQTLSSAGLPVPAFSPIESVKEVENFGESFGWPLLLKARRNGYDGRGNVTLRDTSEIENSCRQLGWPQRTLMVEQFVPFVKELAVMVSRSVDGSVELYPVAETVQKNHICHTVSVPAEVSARVIQQASHIARRAIEAVDGVGVFGVEMFLTAREEILINELAPRTHNSGHYSIEACQTSQFENHLRAVLGLPLGSAKLVAPAAMVNLLGSSEGKGIPQGMAQALAIPGANIHLYGKLESRVGRKMGHITVLAPGGTAAEALARASEAAAIIQF